MNIKDRLIKCINKIENMTKEEVIESIKDKGLEKEIFEIVEAKKTEFIIYSKLNDYIKI
ncbi:MAG: hypothetical protein E7C50_00280 [Clostridium sp.]|uniref:hypothetical protein n=1 Tax=Clostridium sp. TaxID=1506 RepID=UPI002903AC7D|nr:hypothetical protein [Clostridium sp.]MDU2674200.1 hypothetical protein [Clostridium sp.]MDU2680295.1 hypothetical protein [Clostridium sp.]